MDPTAYTFNNQRSAPFSYGGYRRRKYGNEADGVYFSTKVHAVKAK